MKRLIKASDLEGLTVEITPYSNEDDKYGHFESYGINATLDGQRVGFLNLFVYQDYVGGEISRQFEGQKVEKMLYFDDFEVDSNQRGKGIANEILKKLGELYREKFSGWPMFNMYINPVAEYAVINAIAQGWLPEEAFIEEYQLRGSAYFGAEDQIIDLRNKLPEEYQHLFVPKRG